MKMGFGTKIIKRLPFEGLSFEMYSLRQQFQGFSKEVYFPVLIFRDSDFSV